MIFFFDLALPWRRRLPLCTLPGLALRACPRAADAAIGLPSRAGPPRASARPAPTRASPLQLTHQAPSQIQAADRVGAMRRDDRRREDGARTQADALTQKTAARRAKSCVLGSWICVRREA